MLYVSGKIYQLVYIRLDLFQLDCKLCEGLRGILTEINALVMLFLKYNIYCNNILVSYEIYEHEFSIQYYGCIKRGFQSLVLTFVFHLYLKIKAVQFFFKTTCSLYRWQKNITNNDSVIPFHIMTSCYLVTKVAFPCFFFFLTFKWKIIIINVLE